MLDLFETCTTHSKCSGGLCNAPAVKGWKPARCARPAAVHREASSMGTLIDQLLQNGFAISSSICALGRPTSSRISGCSRSIISSSSRLHARWSQTANTPDHPFKTWLTRSATRMEAQRFKPDIVPNCATTTAPLPEWLGEILCAAKILTYRSAAVFWVLHL